MQGAFLVHKLTFFWEDFDNVREQKVGGENGKWDVEEMDLIEKVQW